MRIFDDLNDETLRIQFEEALDKMYRDPNPKDSHAFLAELANHNLNLCPCYVTTNYDLHLEDQIGVGRLEVLVHEQLKNLKGSKHDKPVYLKIHGSVEKRRTNGALRIAIFLPNVSDSKIKQEIEGELEYVFLDKDSPQKILFLGYSFSDVYDIVKWMNDKLKHGYEEFEEAGKKYMSLPMTHRPVNYFLMLTNIINTPVKIQPEISQCFPIVQFSGDLQKEL